VKRDETIGGMVLLLFGMVTIILALRMPLGTFRMAGTGLFPLCLGILLMVLSGLFLLRRYLQARKKTEEKGRAASMAGSPGTLAFFFGSMILTTLFFNTFGYPLASFLLVGSLLRILGMKRWGLNILISVLTAAGCYFLFVQWLQIPLPKGWIGL
jgi:putative tricarboxylic transport membrane protein